MKPFLEVITWAAFAMAMIVAPISGFRAVRAKTRAAYWKNNALFVIPILLVFLLAYGVGLTPETPTLPPPRPQDVFGKMPTAQLVLLGIVAAIWIGGGNVLFYFHNRRLGKKWSKPMNPLDPPFKDINTRKWLILGALVVVSLGFGAAAISIGQRV
jgi:hypothetical protein